MKWHTNPQLGDYKKIRRFAWLPKQLPDGMTVWLGWYTTQCTRVASGDKFYRWHVVDFY